MIIRNARGTAILETMLRPLKGNEASARFIAGACLGFFVVAAFFYFPGNLGWDATAQWYDARTGVLATHHPPFMAFVWHWLDRAYPGPGLMLLAELATFWTAAGLFARYCRASRAISFMILLALACQPFLIAHAALVEKNVIAGNLALIALALLLEYPRSRTPGIRVGLAGLVLACAGLMRFQFWVLIVVVLPFILFATPHAASWQGRLRRAAWPMAAALLAFLAGLVSASALMNATLTVRPSTDRNWRQVILYDIGAVAVLAPDETFATLDRHGIDIGTLRRVSLQEMGGVSMFAWTEAGRYASIADNVGHVLGEPSTNDATHDRQLALGVLTAQWWDLLARRPGIFLTTRLAAFTRLLGLGGVVQECWPLTVVGYLGRPDAAWAELNGVSLQESFATTLLRNRIFPAATFVFRPVTYLVMSLGLLFVCYRSRTPALARLALPLVGAWLYWLTFFPFNADCEVRYSYFSCAAILFAMVAAAGLVLQGAAHRRPAAAN